VPTVALQPFVLKGSHENNFADPFGFDGITAGVGVLGHCASRDTMAFYMCKGSSLLLKMQH
jgi:hypothetical protein